jgi:hypothetical protein
MPKVGEWYMVRGKITGSERTEWFAVVTSIEPNNKVVVEIPYGRKTYRRRVPFAGLNNIMAAEQLGSKTPKAKKERVPRNERT